ncbi:MAG TPA: PaaI family thioesterase [Streptosporangiaceae bacterium]
MNAHPMQQVLDSMPFAAGLGIELDSAAPEQVTARLAWAPRLCTTGGLLHGGALMAFADSIGGLCAFLNLPEGAGTATISSSTNFLRAVRGGVVHGTARRLHAGRTVIVVQTDLTDDSGKPAAQTTQAQAVIPPR